MKVNKYGQEPKVVGEFQTHASEMCFVQYLPIAFNIEDLNDDRVLIPKNLQWASQLVFAATDDCEIADRFHYIYLTVKHLYVTASNMGNRPGWHSDGFGTDDINYIWCDKYPTEFCIQDFNITEDCQTSLKEMETQVKVSNIKTYGEKTLLRLDKYNIHRTPIIGEGYRTFVKISISKDRYNLKGNAHNHLFDYNWEMLPRLNTRNHPSK